MRKTRRLLWGRRTCLGVMALVMVLTMGFAMEHFSFVSHAESKGKVTSSSAVNIRKEPSTSSSAVGSVETGKEIDVRGQVTASDGTTWYQVFVDANTLGYIRSDLIQITDGSTPPTVEATASTTVNNTTTNNTTTGENNTTTNTNETPVDVTAVEPLSATVTNGQKVRVRSNASTTSSIVTSVQSGMALTVTGQATGTDGNVWYQVEFIDNGSNVVGFIRADYVSLSGEVVPASTETPDATEPSEEEPAQTEEPEETKTWETQLQGDTWFLLNMDSNKQYEIDELFNAVQQNGDLYEASQKTVKSQKIAIIILVVLAVAAAAVAVLLFLKIKDAADAAYFSEVEKEVARKRGESRSKNGQKVVHTVGPDKKPGGKAAVVQPQTGRAAGAKAASAQAPGGRAGGKPVSAQAQGGRTAGARPETVQAQSGKAAGARPAGAQGSRAVGARPAGSQSGTRTAGTQSQGARPVGTQQQGIRPVGGQSQGARPVGKQSQGARAAETAKAANTQQAPGWKSKNFMTDDDEFEFEFLNWDGEDEQ